MNDRWNAIADVAARLGGRLRISETRADLYTILAIAIMFPLIGIAKLYFARIMARNTWLKTPIGSWLVRMFVAIGLTFIFVGFAYGLAYAAAYQWIELSVWMKWPLRIVAVLCGLVSIIATSFLVRHLMPLLREVEKK